MGIFRRLAGVKAEEVGRKSRSIRQRSGVGENDYLFRIKLEFSRLIFSVKIFRPILFDLFPRSLPVILPGGEGPPTEIDGSGQREKRINDPQAKGNQPTGQLEGFRISGNVR